MSRGHAYEGPGPANACDPQQWEVATYPLSPASITVQQGDSSMLSVFIANGDHHRVQLTTTATILVLPR